MFQASAAFSCDFTWNLYKLKIYRENNKNKTGKIIT